MGIFSNFIHVVKKPNNNSNISYASLPTGTTYNTSTNTLTASNISTTSTISTTYSNEWMPWTKEEKKTIADVGFTYNKKTKEWIIKLSVDIRISQEDGFSLSDTNFGGTPTEQMICKLKQAKKELVEKLTTKIILAELTRPSKIKK